MFDSLNNRLGGLGRNYFVFAGAFLLIMFVAGGGYFVWTKYFSKEAKDIAVFKNYQKQVEDAYRNDTYGGVTPEETLRLFMEALKKEDVELASKYFALDDNLNRDEWLNHLSDLKNRNLLSLMARDIETRAKPDLKNRLYENDYKFVLYTDDGRVGAEIDMELNPVSKVWKIESL